MRTRSATGATCRRWPGSRASWTQSWCSHCSRVRCSACTHVPPLPGRPSSPPNPPSAQGRAENPGGRLGKGRDRQGPGVGVGPVPAGLRPTPPTRLVHPVPAPARLPRLGLMGPQAGDSRAEEVQDARKLDCVWLHHLAAAEDDLFPCVLASASHSSMVRGPGRLSGRLGARVRGSGDEKSFDR